MEIRYSTRHGEVTDTIDWWLDHNLQKGGIECQIRKSRNLLVLMGTAFLKANPALVNEVANAIECDGYQYEIKES